MSCNHLRRLSKKLMRIKTPPRSRAAWMQFLAITAGIFLSGRADAIGANDKVHRVIAGMIAKMPAFTKWPTEPDFRSTKVATLAVMTANDATFAAFKREMDGRQSGGLTWKVKRVRTLAETTGYQFVFFGKEFREPELEWYRTRKTTGVLTFGEKETRSDRSAIFSFVVVKGRLRFDVDMVAAGEANVSIDPRLFKLARKVRTKR